MKSDKAIFYQRLEKVLINAGVSFGFVTAIGMVVIYLIDLTGFRPSFLGYGTAYLWAFIGMLIYCQMIVNEMFEYEQTSIYNEQDFELQDEKYQEAKDLVIKAGQVSTAFLMRELGITYSRSRIIIDMLEDDGVVEPWSGEDERVQKVKS